MRRCAIGALRSAVRPLEAAVAQAPDDVRYARDLGAVYAALGRWPDALRVLTPVLGSLDVEAQAAYLLAGVEARAARGAVEDFERAVGDTISSDPRLLCEYGRALFAAGRTADAGRALRACAASREAPANVHDALATLYDDCGHGDRALVHAAAYAQRQPHSAYAQLRYATALSMRGRLDESRIRRLRALRLGVHGGSDWTAVLHLMLCDGRVDGRIFARVSAQAFDGIRPRPRRTRRTSGAGRLRIGYISPEFDVAPATFFLDPFLQAHDRTKIEVFLYDTRREPVPAGSRRAALGEHLRDIGHLDDDAAADLIAADGLDVLVELSSHFVYSRLRVLARRPALVQATLPQCPATTGCREVDYLFTDRWTSPPGSEAEYIERLQYLSCGHVIYAPPAICPPARPSPAEANGYVTFGLLQRFMKLESGVWDAVAAALRATPDSRLLLHTGDPELSRPESATNGFLREQLARRRIDPARLDLVGRREHAEHLDLLSGIDIALDTWPYSGTTTTCECLWMGVPVVTLAGRTHASRVSAAILRRMGLDALVAKTPGGYARIATRLAADLEALRGYRATLRDRFIGAGLTDGRALAAEMEAAYTRWVAEACARPRRRRTTSAAGAA
jgi:protein O-GlcNAc transferase